MPCDYSLYPSDWKWLSKQVIATAKDRCELCYAPNGAVVCRSENAIDSDEHPWRFQTDTDAADEEKTTKIILTVHHIDSDKTNSKKQNLIALCQRCHLRLDLQKHMINRSKGPIYSYDIFE